ncbi:DUF1998 domain-containing protein [Mucilaginibacter rubeus]|uniref:DUF1998 domain-containing protein n=1 Tax=Mucilaginibacter rubeus TaxID=2027860 RepID=A0A5C1HSU3_9SPHI|nr:DUF1998 domain-containing protein [Mucilaginibacter rubeus]QEM09077.1 hypothetical protein DEO27_003270 [Mucilaginibacter rubeus]
MDIYRNYQYNQGIGKYKLLSSTAGVGSIITTRMGLYILVSDVNKWRFMQRAQAVVAEIHAEEPDDRKRYERSRRALARRGVHFVDDARFVAFLREEKGLSELICLIGIPDISLDDQFNSPKWSRHPVNQLLRNNGETAVAEDFMVLGTHFPKWFRNNNGDLKNYQQWRALWASRRHPLDHFVPPRDADHAVKVNGVELRKRFLNADKVPYEQTIYEPLTQINLALICPNGHISDIPWQKFLRWRTEILIHLRNQQTDKGADLFNDQSCEPCCPNPKLRWTESKTRSEGYGSIFIECLNCQMGSGGTGQPKVNLEGINNLKPICPGHKPWEIQIEGDSHAIPFERCTVAGAGQRSEEMQVALVTGNNIYYANGFSSIYIPERLIDPSSPEERLALQTLERMHSLFPSLAKEQFCNLYLNEGFLDANAIVVPDRQALLAKVRDAFLGVDADNDEGLDLHEQYRWQEYQCFTKNGLEEVELQDLKFKDIDLPTELSAFFSKVQQIEELRVTQVQLDFTRVKPKERIRRNNEIVESTDGQDIYSVEDNELLVLPANASLGEGLFFQFNDEAINAWAERYQETLIARFHRFAQDVTPGSQGTTFKQKIRDNGWKHFLVHSFSHMMMRELEFSCGYPTASLKERLYISERLNMNGVLIYTADGSEGSMGGLVWQGQPINLTALVKKGLSRSIDCSSDPLCWESEGQGLFDLNLAACFSCALVSETACEEMNLGLDRTVLVDEVFGFFKDLIP